MKQSALIVLVPGVLFSVAFGQKPQETGFDVASVRKDIQLTRPTVREDAGSVSYTYIALNLVILKAYQIKPHQLSGPSWLSSEFYDIHATLPEGSTPGQIPEMLRRLLKERFNAVVHWEDRQMMGYALELVKRPPKFKECKSDECPRELIISQGGTNGFGRGMIRLQSRTFGKLADQLAGVLQEPVIDETGLAGTYVIALNTHALGIDDNESGHSDRITVDGQAIDIPETTPSVFDALKELGLRVVHRKLTIKRLVVDQINRIPTEN